MPWPPVSPYEDKGNEQPDSQEDSWKFVGDDVGESQGQLDEGYHLSSRVEESFTGPQ